MSKVSDTAVEALAAFLIERDCPTMRLGPSRRWEYQCMAAAILNGEEWALRKAWPVPARWTVATATQPGSPADAVRKFGEAVSAALPGRQ